MTSYAVVKCVVESTQDVLRLRVALPLEWETLRSTLAKAFGPLAASKYEDEENDWCTLAENTFEDFMVLNHDNLHTSQRPVVKLRVSDNVHAESAFGVHACMAPLPIPDGVAQSPAEACGPKPFLAALQQLSCGTLGGWTASNVCTLILAFMPTLEQRALRKVEKMNKNGSFMLESLRDTFEQLLVQLVREPGLEDVARFLRDMLGGKRVDKFGNFVIDFARALRTLPCSKQNELLVPALSVLLKSRPNFFTEVFGEQTSHSGPQPGVDGDMLELPSGRRVPVDSILEPKALTQPYKVHLACLGVKSVPRNAWANLRISDKGVVGVGGVGAFATFTMQGEGQNADGLQKVSLQSCGGGGYLGSQGVASFSGGLPGPNATFVLKPLGCKGAGENNPPSFALLLDTDKDHAMGVGPGGGIRCIAADKLHESNNCAAFLILDARTAQASKADSFKKESEQKCAQPAKWTGPRQMARLEANVAKQAAKLEEKCAKAVVKAAEQASRQAAKLAQKETERASKVAAQIAKEEIKAAKLETKVAQVTELSDIVDGTLLFVESNRDGNSPSLTTGRLRILQDGCVDTMGGWGKWPIFVVHLHEKAEGVLSVALQSQAVPERYLRLPVGTDCDLKNLAGDGHGPGQTDSIFQITYTGATNDCEHTFNLQPAACEMAEQKLPCKTGCNVKLYSVTESSSRCEVVSQQHPGLQEEDAVADSDWSLEGSGEQHPTVEMQG